MKFKIDDVVYDKKYNEVFQVSKGDMYALEHREEDFRIATEEEKKNYEKSKS